MSRVAITVNGESVQTSAVTSVAAALINTGIWTFRTDTGGRGRGPICAMGICFECRVTIDGVAHRRACLETCREGMEIHTGE